MPKESPKEPKAFYIHRIPLKVFRGDIAGHLENAEKGRRYLIVRKNVDTALLGPLIHEENADTISVRTLTRHFRDILNDVLKGKRFVIESNHSGVAILVPPIPEDRGALSPDQLGKLMLVDGLSLENVRRLVATVSAEAKMSEIMKKIDQ